MPRPLAPLLRAPQTRERILAAATDLAQQQATLVGEGAPPLAAASVVRSLAKAAEAKPARRAPKEVVLRGRGGQILARGQAGRGGQVSISLPNASGRDPRRDQGNDRGSARQGPAERRVDAAGLPLQ
ncbi:MAG: hypothetical protein WDN49_17675 [Acetobacteraceae bacterium]